MFGILARNGRVLEVEPVLAVNVGQIDAWQHAPLRFHLGKQRRAGHRRVEHELVEVGIVRHRVFEFGLDVLGGMVFEAHDGGPQQLDAVLPELGRELTCVRSVQFGVLGVGRFEAHPDPRDAQFHQFPHGVLIDGVGG